MSCFLRTGKNYQSGKWVSRWLTQHSNNGKRKGRTYNRGFAKIRADESYLQLFFAIVLHIGLDIYYLAFVCYLQLQFFNHHRFRVDGILIPVLRQALSVEPTSPIQALSFRFCYFVVSF